MPKALDPSLSLAKSYLQSRCCDYLKRENDTGATVNSQFKRFLHQGLIKLASSNNNKRVLDWQSLFSWIDSWRDSAKAIKQEDAQVFVDYISKLAEDMPLQVKNFLSTILNEGMKKLYHSKQTHQPDWKKLGNYLNQQLASIVHATVKALNIGKVKTPPNLDELNASMNEGLAAISCYQL